MPITRLPAELLIALAFAVVMLALSVGYGLPMRLPVGGGAAFVGIHYLLPLLGIGLWGCCALLGGGGARARTFLIALPCYALVLLIHFNLKLWAPHIEPNRYDALFWSWDNHLRPLVDGAMAIRRLLEPLLSYESNLYMVGFIILFYISFCYHAMRAPATFRHLFLAALLFQGLGGIAYLLAPALGPFVFEPGVSPVATGAQQAMLDVYHQSMAGGSEWLSANGATWLLAGLGAMPSLHVGGSFLFLWFAWRDARVLLPLYLFLFSFIVVTAIANRWHYLIDLPAGIALALLSIHLAARMLAAEARRAPVKNTVGLPVSCAV